MAGERAARRGRMLTTIVAGVLIAVVAPMSSVVSAESRPGARHELESRLVRRLGPSNRGADPRVSIDDQGTTMTITWVVDRPDPTTDPSTARQRVLRRELRSVLRVLAALELPARTLSISLRATSHADALTDLPADAVVLDAIFFAETLIALEADDVRLEDATLAELLGVAAFITGDPSWGVPDTSA
jgi:hypothetical protein